MFKRTILLAVAVFGVSLSSGPLEAAITPSGDVSPADPSTWSSWAEAYIGKTGIGSVIADGGSELTSYAGYLGYNSGSAGTVTIDGAGSNWSNSGPLEISREGKGTLNIINGGEVSSGKHTLLNKWGVINFNNGSLATLSFAGYSDNLCGTGTISTCGLVSDVDLVFDATHGLDQTFTINDNQGQDITVHYNASYGCSAKGAGYGGSGTMSISDGLNLISILGYLGCDPGSSGEATVYGAGSGWQIFNTGEYVSSGYLSVGVAGSGKLNVIGGGFVSSERSYIGELPGSTGEVIVNGVGSRFMITYDGGPLNRPADSGKLLVGDEGSGFLTISGGGLVLAEDGLTIDSKGDGNSFVNMSTGGMLALAGEADGSIAEFLGLVEGTDAIQYWDGLDWALITDGTMGEDYWLDYCSTGDLAGYTMLTVGVVPEPGAVTLLLLGLATLLVARRRR